MGTQTESSGNSYSDALVDKSKQENRNGSLWEPQNYVNESIWSEGSSSVSKIEIESLFLSLVANYKQDNV